MKLKCYICGKKVASKFMLATMSEETDRVFLVHTDCAKRLENDVTVVEVEQLKPTKELRR